MLNILIPCAGEGSRFKQAGYKDPKPLIEIEGDKRMIQCVVESLDLPNANYIFLIRREHDENLRLTKLLERITKFPDIIYVDELTQGAACTTLLAEGIINNKQPLLLANSDQLIWWHKQYFFEIVKEMAADAGILTFNAKDPKWSYAKLDINGYVEKVAEKVPISHLATCGIYYWERGEDYVRCAKTMIENNDRTNGEFYVCPVFNWAIKEGLKVINYNVSKMIGLGTPIDVDNYQNFKVEN